MFYLERKVMISPRADITVVARGMASRSYYERNSSGSKSVDSAPHETTPKQAQLATICLTTLGSSGLAVYLLSQFPH